ncbi:ion transporter [Bittarella sp. HCP28S3_D9]|uniref:ion transporter n=1 Tax=Bittarella sp. HCP28S3_D9 TaxID=3440253 RepID=UPI003F8BF13F
MKHIKKQLFKIIQTAEDGDRLSKAFDLSIIFLIIVNVIIVIVETFTISNSLRTIFSQIETVSVIIFTCEYILRVWTADLLYPNAGPVVSRLKYIFSFMAIIDLLAILPFYIPFVIPVDLRVLRMLRVIRLLRLFKVNRYTNALSKIGEVFKRKASQLFSSMFVVFLLMVIASVIMYNVENSAQPEVFNNAFSGLWWAVATLTTVGYGDIYPITVAGKILSAIIAVLGIGLVAVPTGIISSGFMEQIEQEKKSQEDHKDKKHFCPYCGHQID